MLLRSRVVSRVALITRSPRCGSGCSLLAHQVARAAQPSIKVHSSSNGVHSTQQMVSTTVDEGPRNVLGTPLACCCTSPVTGYYRDGFCRTDASDQGRHVICAKLTQAFLEFSKSRGNDLMTPAPWFSFPGLKDGDKWCLCASRWKEALEAGVAPPVYLKCTHAKALEYVTMEQLKAHAVDLDESTEL